MSDERCKILKALIFHFAWVQSGNTEVVLEPAGECPAVPPTPGGAAAPLSPGCRSHSAASCCLLVCHRCPGSLPRLVSSSLNLPLCFSETEGTQGFSKRERTCLPRQTLPEALRSNAVVMGESYPLALEYGLQSKAEHILWCCFWGCLKRTWKANRPLSSLRCLLASQYECIAIFA